jgi:hypothetical protein
VFASGLKAAFGLIAVIGCGSDHTTGGGSGGSSAGGGSTPTVAANCAQRANPATFCDATASEQYAWDCDVSPSSACLESGEPDVWCCPQACAPLDPDVHGWHCTDATMPRPWGCYDPETDIQTPTGCGASDTVEIICCPDGADY